METVAFKSGKARNKVWAYLVETFSKPAYNPEKQWTAVVTTRYFKGSFDFETFEKAREYLESQCARKGVTTSDNAKDTVQFGGTFIINRETFAVSSLADLGLAFERSNPWGSARNTCLTAAEHAVRVNRVLAYLAKRKARAAVPGKTAYPAGEYIDYTVWKIGTSVADGRKVKAVDSWAARKWAAEALGGSAHLYMARRA